VLHRQHSYDQSIDGAYKNSGFCKNCSERSIKLYWEAAASSELNMAVHDVITIPYLVRACCAIFSIYAFVII